MNLDFTEIVSAHGGMKARLKRLREIIARNIRTRVICENIFVKIIILINEHHHSNMKYLLAFRTETLASGMVMDFSENDILPTFHTSKMYYRRNNIGNRSCTYLLWVSRSRVDVNTRKRACGKRKWRSRNCWKNIEPISNLWLQATAVSLYVRIATAREILLATKFVDLPYGVVRAPNVASAIETATLFRNVLFFPKRSEALNLFLNALGVFWQFIIVCYALIDVCWLQLFQKISYEIVKKF